MSNLIISGIRWQIDNFKKSFLQFEKRPFNDFFPAKTIAAIIANTPHKRASVFSPLITLQAFIFEVLSDDSRGQCFSARHSYAPKCRATKRCCPTYATGIG